MKKNNQKDPVFKTSIVCEGEMDRSLIIFLKVKLYKSKQPVCKTHSEVIGGTIKLDNVKVNKNKIYSSKYIHTLVVLEKILLHLKNIIDDEKNDYTLIKFEENLKHYNSHEKLYTNLIEYINHLTIEREN